MDRMINTIIRSAVRQLTNRGISGGINYVSKRASGRSDRNANSVEQVNVEIDQVNFDNKAVRRKMRVNKRRF